MLQVPSTHTADTLQIRCAYPQHIANTYKITWRYSKKTLRGAPETLTGYQNMRKTVKIHLRRQKINIFRRHQKGYAKTPRNRSAGRGRFIPGSDPSTRCWSPFPDCWIFIAHLTYIPDIHQKVCLTGNAIRITLQVMRMHCLNPRPLSFKIFELLKRSSRTHPENSLEHPLKIIPGTAADPLGLVPRVAEICSERLQRPAENTFRQQWVHHRRFTNGTFRKPAVCTP